MNIKTFEDLKQGEVKVSMFGQELAVSVFMIDGLLIDTGPIKKKVELIKVFKQWDISNVILTHYHEDHTGLASWLQNHHQIPIYIHKLGVEKCIDITNIPLYRNVFWGKRKSFQPLPLGKEFKTELYTWDIIHTPGHSEDHIALYNREKKWMFGGDLYVQPKPKSMFAFESLPETIRSLEKTLTYDFSTYICSHAGFIPNGRRALEKKLDYLVSVQEKVLDLYQKGVSPHDIRKRLFPNNHPMNYLSFFENSPRHIIRSVLSNL